MYRCVYCGAEIKDTIKAYKGWSLVSLVPVWYCSLSCKAFEKLDKGRTTNANRPRTDQNVEEAS